MRTSAAVTRQQEEWAGFTKANAAIKQRLIAASFGEVGTLKTSFWLSAPGPIAMFSLDMGLEGVIEPYQSQKDIWVKEYSWAPTDSMEQQEAVDLRDSFIADFAVAVLKARTIVIDKETQLWEVFRYAEFGPKVIGAPPRDYPRLYQRYRQLINSVKPTDVNFGLIQGMRTPWLEKVNPKTGAASLAKTALRERKGMDEVDELVHINIEHFFEDGEFKMRVGKARGPGGRDVQNQVLPAMEFADFAGLVFPDSSPADWL